MSRPICIDLHRKLVRLRPDQHDDKERIRTNPAIPRC